MNATATFLALQIARAEVESALPTAPVIGGRREPAQPVRTARAYTARALRQAADLLAPAAAPTCN